MKTIIVLAFLLVVVNTRAQEVSKETFDGHKWEAPYHLPVPKGWTIERFLIPINFAPSIAYKGVEDIRFTSGWGDAKSDEYWTYAFLWYLDGAPITDAGIIATNLKAYYTGLVEINREGYKVPVEKIIPVVTSFSESKTDKGDLKTYRGTITMLDYMQQQPITLNCIAHLKTCTDDNKTIIFYELSPKPLDHKNWVGLNQLWLDFKCKKK